MDKILVRLDIPVIPDTYDVWLPGCLKIKELIPLLVKAAAELSGEIYHISGSEYLCRCENGQILNEENTLSGCGISNGEYLMLL